MSDGTTTDTGTLTITVTAVNDAPTVVNRNESTEGDNTTLSGILLLDDDSDVDGDTTDADRHHNARPMARWR